MEWYRERFADKTVLVTGASSGIGKAAAERLLEEGATVVAADVSVPPDVDETLQLPRDRYLFVQTDVREEDAAVEAVSAAVEVGGRLDGVVHAAGVAGGGVMHLLDRQEWERVIAINLTGTFVVAKAALAQMLSQDRIDGERGAICAVASVSALEAASGGGPFGAATSGIVALCRTLAVEYGRMGIRSNAVCPGVINSPMSEAAFSAPGLRDTGTSYREAHALQRFGEPEEVAAAALFLISPDASFVSGAALTVDGGYTAGRDHGITSLLEIGDADPTPG
ncbi:MAG TPA: SDR family oxidoreductase [Acidimicrobiales bacterium]|nr:SDR family oxidoreductase [Acidimicrobiales bacterium]